MIERRLSEFAKAFIFQYRDPGLNLRVDQIFSYSACIETEVKPVAYHLLIYLCITTHYYHFLKLLAWCMPVFIKHSELNQYIFKAHFQMVPLHIHIAVKDF
jgi:hypothetical protein